ncbi:hypothetical protein TrCOL_g1347 [Triparma columacea]|uniref:RNA helicase n=1 Tax=Triparma columacea TaxID=722753 RepID=A0A9W7G6A7_9STRA|nr:hypothetical protein TrCOL_g1347 [Triparma columacea]
MQVDEIRRHYIGRTEEEMEQDHNRKKEKKMKEKRNRFKFQWEASEDTARDADPLYDISTRKALMKKSVDPLLLSTKGSSSQNRALASETVYSKPLSEMSVRDWRIIREDFDIRVRGGRAPNPLRSFQETDPVLHPSLVTAITQTLGYTKPSPIQRQAIPIGLQRRDMIGIAETGSGKTAAFGIPMCHHILTLDDEILNSCGDNGPLAVVMAPTRELALQIEEEMQKLLSMQNVVKTLSIVGGQSIDDQAFHLRNGVHIVVGTPGRMEDVLNNSFLILNQCSYIVLDEADRMLDMGFEPQLNAVLEAMGGLMKSDDETQAYEQELKDLRENPTKVPKHRLTAMFSATMPAEVERLARTFLRHPAIISVGDQGSRKNQRIEQRVMYISAAQKDRELANMCASLRPNDKVIVFVNEKKSAEKVARTIEKNGKKTVVLHGGKAQDLREQSLAQFKEGGRILVATDVAGRGIDVADVTHVVNYDVPTKIDNYCHRIGRTGRAGKSGIAVSFLTDSDTEIMPALLKYLKDTKSYVPEKLSRNKVCGGDSDTHFMK